jgi:hypothetical protein
VVKFHRYLTKYGGKYEEISVHSGCVKNMTGDVEEDDDNGNGNDDVLTLNVH